MQTQSATPVSPSLVQQHAEATKRLSELSSDRLEKAVPREASGTHGDAVILSVSETRVPEQGGDSTEVDALRGSPLPRGESNLGLIELNSPDRGESMSSYWDEVATNSEIASAEGSIVRMSAFMEISRDRIRFLEKTEPVPARVLKGDEAEETLRMLEAFNKGEVLMGVSETGRRSWSVDGLSYALDPDGTLSVSEAGVPTSEEEKSYLLKLARDNLEYFEIKSLEAKGRISSLLPSEREILA